MKRLIILFAIAALLAAGSVFAQSDNHDVDITVNSVAILSVVNSGGTGSTLTLTQATAGQSSYTQDTDVVANGISWSHNQAGNQEIVATAVADGGNAANDITLAVQYAAAGYVTIVNSGTDQANVDMISALGAGASTQNLTYRADGSLAGTPAGSYSWTVTYTIQNDT